MTGFVKHFFTPVAAARRHRLSRWAEVPHDSGSDCQEGGRSACQNLRWWATSCSDYVSQTLQSVTDWPGRVMRRATVVQRKPGGAVQLLLGHTKLEGTVRHLGIELEDVLEIAEGTGA